jgi:threonine/homoserine/homoserine lactone efflux protein
MSLQSTILAGLAGLLIGAISPGPSFIVVARNSIGNSRWAGLATAIGMGTGGVVFSVIALLGVFTLLVRVEWLYISVKATGGTYLIYLGYQLWRGSTTPLSFESIRGGGRTSGLRSFWTGLTTQLSNPKAAAIYVSVFAGLLPQRLPAWCDAVLPSAVFGIDTGWYGLVAVLFSSQRAREYYGNSKIVIDRVAAIAIMLLGLRLILTAGRGGV